MSRVAIITGGARGVGLACARRFCEDGYKVVVADENQQVIEQARDTLSVHGASIVFINCDVSDELSVNNLVTLTLNHFDQIDVLINNAGIVCEGGILDLEPGDFDAVLSVNLRGAYFVSRAVIRHMVSEIEGRSDRSRLDGKSYAIINMSPIDDTVATGNLLACAVSKGGVRQMTTAMAVELAPYGICVNGIGPGSVVTDMLPSAVPKDDRTAKIRAHTPLGRVAQADEIAAVAAFLASGDASYITGQIIYVDGGRLPLNDTMPPGPGD